MAEIESLVNSRNKARGALLAALDDFLQEVDKLPINERLDKLKVCSDTLNTHSRPDVPKKDIKLQSISWVFLAL